MSIGRASDVTALEIRQPPRTGELAAARIDFPEVSTRVAGTGIEIVGWAVGRANPLVEVRARAEGEVLARAPMAPGRPDVAAEHPGAAQGRDVTFHLTLATVPPGTITLNLEGLIAGGAVSLGSVVLQRHVAEPVAGAVILTYHRIIDLAAEPWSLSVSPGHFAEHLDVLRREATVWPLDRLVETLRAGEPVPERTAVITFDDGYFDNLLHALPLLDQAALPATVFITTGFVGQDREFWWDELDRLLLQHSRLPSELNLVIDGRRRTWELGADACYPEARAREYACWRAGSGSYPTARHRVYRELWEAMLGATERERDSLRQQLLKWSGLPPEGRATHRSLTDDELVALSRSPLIKIGSHTVTHPVLARLPREAQALEISASNAALRERLGSPVLHFAYPFGQPEHYSEVSLEVLAEEGVHSALANHPGLVTSESEVLALNRFIAQDLDGEGFARMLHHAFAGG